MKTHGSWMSRTLVAGMRWWAALVLVAGPGAIVMGQIVQVPGHFKAKFGVAGSGDESVSFPQITIKNETGGPVYDLLVEVRGIKQSVMSSTVVDPKSTRNENERDPITAPLHPAGMPISAAPRRCGRFFSDWLLPMAIPTLRGLLPLVSWAEKIAQSRRAAETRI